MSARMELAVAALTPRGVVVEARFEAKVGQGEASPLAGYSFESRDELVAAAGVHLPMTVEWPAAGDAIEHLEELFSKIAPVSLRFALETAAIDSVSRARNCAFAQLLCAKASPHVPVSVLIDDRVPLGPQITRITAFGYDTLKLKVGRNRDSELACVRAIRDRFPDAILRLDANQRLRASSAREWIAPFAECDVALIEEPVPPSQGAQLCAPWPIPIALDEALAHPESHERALADVAAGRLHTLVLKPMRLGLATTWSLARAVQAHGRDPILTHCFDGPIAMTATAEIARALALRVACGLAPHAQLGAWSDYPIRIREGALYRGASCGLSTLRDPEPGDPSAASGSAVS